MKVDDRLKIDRYVLVMFIIISMTIGVIEGHYLTTKDDWKDCSLVEGFYVECFDSKGGDWLSIYPVNYLNSSFDAFSHAQMCQGSEVERNYSVCVRGD